MKEHSLEHEATVLIARHFGEAAQTVRRESAPLVIEGEVKVELLYEPTARLPRASWEKANSEYVQQVKEITGSNGIDPANKAIQHLRTAEHYIRRGQQRQASRPLNQAMKRLADSQTDVPARPFLRAAIVAARLNKPDTARQALSSARRAQSDGDKWLVELAEAILAGGKSKRAISHVLGSIPDSAAAAYTLLTLLDLCEGDIEAAVEDLTEAAAEHPIESD